MANYATLVANKNENIYNIRAANKKRRVKKKKSKLSITLVSGFITAMSMTRYNTVTT